MWRAAVPRVAARRRHRTITPSCATAAGRPPSDAATAVQPAGERHAATRFARADSGLPTVTAAWAASGPAATTTPATASAGRVLRISDRTLMALRRLLRRNGKYARPRAIGPPRFRRLPDPAVRRPRRSRVLHRRA